MNVYGGIVAHLGDGIQALYKHGPETVNSISNVIEERERETFTRKISCRIVVVVVMVVGRKGEKESQFLQV